PTANNIPFNMLQKWSKKMKSSVLLVTNHSDGKFLPSTWAASLLEYGHRGQAWRCLTSWQKV
ncbi:MAG: hypothetical protein EBT60_08555, partial [Bacteroidetes bacterium]|nr:hypothetical protein [Bacteroidota bacterium]